jgi:hypothetical protein
MLAKATREPLRITQGEKERKRRAINIENARKKQVYMEEGSWQANITCVFNNKPNVF